jgi:hypothetical protein
MQEPRKKINGTVSNNYAYTKLINEQGCHTCSITALHTRFFYWAKIVAIVL